MNSEAVVVVLFFLVRVLLVGGIFLAFPRITRKGLLFGTYVGEVFAASEEARALRRGWDRGCLAVMGLSLFVGLTIAATGRAVAGNLTGTVVLLLLFSVLYVRTHRKVRSVLPASSDPGSTTAVASLSAGVARGSGVAKLALAVCVLTSLATMIWTMLRYEELPEQLPTISRLFGVTEGTTPRSIVALLFLPALNLVLSSGFALNALLIARAKRSVRGGPGGRSVEAQEAFRVITANTFSSMALFICLLLTILSVQYVRLGLAETASLGIVLGVSAGVMILFMLGCLILIMRSYGQGGALREDGSEQAPLTGGLADNAHWFWGVLYVDRDDPSMLVESRFGIGYTFNLGNRGAWLMMGAFGTLFLGLVFLAVAGGVF